MIDKPNKRHISKPFGISGRTLLIAMSGFCVVLWGFVLPRIATWESVRNRVNRFSEAGINPAAIYYTDHPSMQEIEARVARKLSRSDLFSKND
ncbi:MAG: hypothetical protein ACK5PB_17285 [Pirellula sp.]|jgi:hypothetical protein